MKEYIHSKKMQIWNGFPELYKNLLISFIISFRQEIRLALWRITLRIIS